MARFRPFRGLRYSESAVGAMSEVVAPPYDVISPEQRDRLDASSPFNVVKLILNSSGHDAAARYFTQWREQGVLWREEQPAFYLYAQEFEAGGPRRRVGVLGALHLEPFSSGVVLRHETTFEHHKKDRLDLTSKVKANLSPIFGTFSNPDFHPCPDGGWDEQALVDVFHQGVRHMMWALRDPERIEEVRQALAGRQVFIADGHHRYETALNYHRQIHGVDPPGGDDAPGDDKAPTAHVLAFLAAFEDPGMLILPTHRELLDSGGLDHRRFEQLLGEDFELGAYAKSEAGRGELLAALAACREDENGFAIALSGLDHYLLAKKAVDQKAAATSPLAALDVKVLHEQLLGSLLRCAGGGEVKLAYSIEPLPLLDRVDAGTLEGAFLMNATRAEQMAAVCKAGELMPQKSTYFYPKLLSGLLFHCLD